MYYSDKFNQLLADQPSLKKRFLGWFLVGDEPVLIDQSLNKLINLANKSNSNKIYHIPEKGFDYSFLEEVSISGLFDQQNCYIFRLSSLALSKNQLESITVFLKNNHKHQVIFLYDEFRAVDKKRAVVQLFENFGLVVRHMKIKPEHYKSWILQKLFDQKIKLADKTIDLMAHYTQGNPAHMVQLVEKIKLLDDQDSLDQKVIELLDEANLCSVFDFIDSLYQRRCAQSLKKLDTLIKSGESLIKIIFLLDREIRMILNYQSHKTSTHNLAIKQDFIYPAKKSIIERYLKYRTNQELLSASMLLGKLDRSSKGQNNANSRNEINKLVCLLTQ